jgi:hypothetical protein
MLTGLGIEEIPRQRRRALPVLLAVATVLAVIALGGWYLASGSGPAPRHPGLASTSRGHTISVTDALIGQPAHAVIRRLRQDGLRVTVTWLSSHSQQDQQQGYHQPGTVLSVQPTGQLRVGAPVFLTALSMHHYGHGHNGDGGNGGDGNGGG